MRLVALGLLLAVGCGGAEAAARDASAETIACDWCPGLPAAMQCEYTLLGVTMHVCRCSDNTHFPGSMATGMVFRVGPPLADCASTQLAWAASCPSPAPYAPHAACP